VPQNYGLVKEHTHARTHRTLILIAKVLQNLANKNDFSGKEDFMESMNGFIHRNVTKVPILVYAFCPFCCFLWFSETTLQSHARLAAHAAGRVLQRPV
jgi:hypothetical protein